jgi:hypothetical protein
MVRRLSGTFAVCLLATWVLLTGHALAQSTSDTPAGSPALLHGPSFVPDAKFSGSSLGGWKPLGQATWSAENGELVGKGTNGSGWLVLDRSYQDTGFYGAVRCEGACDTGVMLRMTKTGDGIKGTYLSIKGGDLAAENLTLDAAGNVVERKTLDNAGGMIRYAPAAKDPTAPRAAPLAQAVISPPPGVVLPIKRPQSVFRNGDWNEIEMLLDANLMRIYLNDDPGRLSVATDNDDLDSYGPIALFVGKGSEVRFKDVSQKDLALRVDPVEKVGDHFRMQRISPFFYNWSATAADFNHDGKLDLVAGGFIYYGPDFTTRREMYSTRTYNPSDEYSTWVQHAYDFTGDGWPDVVATNFGAGAVLFVNPKGESRRWEQYRVLPPIQSEDSLLVDVDGDGKPELVYVADGYMRYAKPDPANPTGPWVVHSVSERGPWPAHGIGVGDINGDGRMDIVGSEGWWEQPPAGSEQKTWRYHPEAFGRYGRIAPGGATMGVYDVNGDGLNDVVTALEAHGWGLAWFEQKRASNGDISFVEHMVMDNYNTKNAGGVTFAELHGTAVADMDGDGIPDFVVGKRQWSHNDDLLDPDAYGPAVIYWYKTVRDPKAPGGARLEPELIHNSSGAGSDLLTVDLNGDGATDVVTSTKRGTYIFWGIPNTQRSAK